MSESQVGPTTPRSLIEALYGRYPAAVNVGRARLDRPMTFAEKDRKSVV